MSLEDDLMCAARNADSARRRTILSTERLVLTTWTPGDLDELNFLHTDPETMRYIRHGRPESREETQDLLESYLREKVDPGWNKWRLANHSGRLVGRAGFGWNGQDRELTYTIRRDLRGQGLASEIALALVPWHRDNPRAQTGPRLVALAVNENYPSLRVLDKAGLRFVNDVDYEDVSCARYELPIQRTATALK